MGRWLGLARSLFVYWRPGRQRGLRRLYAPFVGPGDLVFDIGAHLGDRTAAFSALGARVVALEPQPDLVPWLRRLVGSRRGVTILPLAAGARPGTADLAVSRANPTLSTLADEWRSSIGRENPTFRGVRWEHTTPVSVTTLDALIEAHGEPTFCKVDVEGYEAEVLAGLSRPLETLSIEFVSGSLDVARQCVTRLQELADYEFNAVRGEERRFRWPDWVDATKIGAWLTDGADDISSGDLYARRTHARQGEDP